MRQVLSMRFLATIVALALLGGLVYLVGRRDEPLAAVAAPTEPRVRRADLITLVYSIEQQGFGIDQQGLSVGQARLIIDGERSAYVYPGTPGEINCPIEVTAGCGALLELLGDAVVSFDLVPLKANPLFTVELPPVRSLGGGLATLANGWQVPYAPVIDRNCDSTDTDSFREFLAEFPDDHVAVFDLGDQQIIQVICQPA